MSAVLTQSESQPAFFAKHRIVVIASAVLLFHALAIWALQSGLLMRAVEMVLPVEVLAQIIEPPKPVPPVPLPPPVIPKEPPPVKQTVAKPTPPVPQTQAPPQILAVETATPAPNAPAPVQIAPPAPLLPPTVPVAAVASPAAPVAPAAVAKSAPITPVCVQDFISQPAPIYPNFSKRLSEQGIVDIRVLFSAAGFPLKAEVIKSSGYERLDNAALESTKRWRFVTCSGIAAAVDHWKETPVRFKFD